MPYISFNNDSILLQIYTLVHLDNLFRQHKYYPDRIRIVRLRPRQIFQMGNSHSNEASTFTFDFCAANKTVAPISPFLHQFDLLIQLVKAVELQWPRSHI